MTVATVERTLRTGQRFVGVILLVMLLGCGDPGATPAVDGSESRPPPFEGAVQCDPGEEDGAAGWDYGANPRGTIDDPVVWMRDNAVGLDAALTLSFVEEVRGETDILENVVLAATEEGAVVAFVEFGRDERGRYFPNRSEMCASAGIEDFT